MVVINIEFRSNGINISGYVNAVERESKVMQKIVDNNIVNFTEKVKVKTFQRAIENAKNIEMRFNHNKVIGSTSDNTLKLKEDAIGLYAESFITDAEVIKKAKNNELRGWSFAFRKNKDSWQDGDVSVRCLEDIDLKEVSILDIEPAYIATSVELRNEDNNELEIRAFNDDNIITTDTNINSYVKTLEFLKLKG